MRAGLAWLGRHGTVIIALGVFVGLLVPPLAALLRPLLVPAFVVPFLTALVRLDWMTLGRHTRRPATALLALLWVLVLSPLPVHTVALAAGVPEAIANGLVLMALAPPITASAAFALMIGLDAALAVLVTITATALVPLTLPPLALYLLGLELDIALPAFMARLALFVGGCFAAALLLRRLLPAGFTERHHEPLDGLAVAGLVVFAIAIMDGVAAKLLAEPAFVLGCLAAALLGNAGLQALSALAFAPLGRRVALTLGFCAGNRNMGLLVAVLADRAAFELVVFFAMAQIPMYTLPALQRPLYRRLLGRPPADRTTAAPGP